jgi:aspartyl-tRNA(Asn)/glutamyl-tRNA(Gln) amidotransferase subunit A
LKHELLSIKELRNLIKNKDVSAVELTTYFLDRIDRIDGDINAFITIDRDMALKGAREVDKEIGRGIIKPLSGIPVAYKDNICINGMRTTCASKMLSNFVPPYSATVYDNLTEAGAIPIGKTNMDEFAMGSSTETSAFKITNNPWDTSRVPGGSSGGSAAAVASGEVPFALGSDTGGSIRQPASYCGIFGIKPTYGRVSRYGVVAYASSLDQVGTFGKSTADIAEVLNVICGYDEKDATSANIEVPDFTKFIGQDIKGLRIGYSKEHLTEGVQREVKDAVIKTLNELEKLGAIIEEVSLPHTKYALPAYYIIGPAEASANLARFDGVRYGYRAEGYKDLIDMYSKTRSEGFGSEVKRRIMVGTYALSSGYYDAYYLKAQKVRTLIKDDFDKAFEKVDLLVSPTAPTVAFKTGTKSEDPVEMYLTDAFTIPVNMAGIPGMSVPCGLADGLPLGIQLMARHFDEKTLIKAGSAIEKCMGFDSRGGIK